jgi:hypothetical protein
MESSLELDKIAVIRHVPELDLSPICGHER